MTDDARQERRRASRIAAAVLEAQGINPLIMMPACIDAVLRELHHTGPHVTGQ